jgi:hypothetical protein
MRAETKWVPATSGRTSEECSETTTAPLLIASMTRIHSKHDDCKRWALTRRRLLARSWYLPSEVTLSGESSGLGASVVTRRLARMSLHH